MIYVFTIATKGYKKYINDYFLPTFNNFLPNVYKKLFILSDGLDELNNYNDNIFSISVIHFPHIYKIDLWLNKFNIINDILVNYNKNVQKSDIFFYFDSDTYFYDNSNVYEQNILNDVKDNLLHFSIHGLDVIKHELWKNDHNTLNNLLAYEHNQENRGICAYVPLDNQLTLMASIFFGTVQALDNFSIIYNKQVDLIFNDYVKIIPTLGDEDIANYLYYLQLSNKIPEIISIKQYANINIYTNEILDNGVMWNSGDNPEYWYNKDFLLNKDYMICNQKINKNKKFQYLNK